MKTLSWRKDLKLNAARCFSGTHASVRFTRETFVDNRLPREACFDQGDVEVEKDILTFNEEEDEHTLMEERPLFERDTVFLRDTCHREVHRRNIRDKRLPREACFDQGDVEVEKDIVTFNEEEDEDTLMEEGPQIERGTVFLRDTCHREIQQRNSRDQRFPHEACFDLDVVKVENVIVAFREEEEEDILVEEGPQI